MNLSRVTLASLVGVALAATFLLALPVAGTAGPLAAVDRAASRGVALSLDRVSFCSTSVGWAVGAQATIAKSTDGGRHWSRQAKSLPPDRGSFTSVRAVSSRVCWAVGTFGVYKTTDGGRTWRRVAKKLRPTAITLNSWSSVTTTGSKVVWLSSTCGDIAKSVNAGRTWTRQNRAKWDDGFGGIACNGSKYAWIPVDSVSTHYGKCVYTTDDGSHWRPLGAGTWDLGTATPRAVCSSSTTTVYLGCGDGAVHRSIDGGNVWEQSTSSVGPGALWLSDIDCVGATVCAVGANASNGAAGIVTNGGAWSWIGFHTKSGAPALRIGDVDMLTSKVGWAVGAGQVFKTVDGGANWQQLR